MTSPAKSTTRTLYDHTNDPWFKNQFIESSVVTVETVPGYLKQRQGEFEDIDGVAFPDSNYVKYNKPSSSQQKPAACGKRMNKRILEMSLDPLDPSNSLKHKRGPKAFGSLPVPVVYLPHRPGVTVKNQQQDWTIPPCISNWENPKGYGFSHDLEISENFAKVSKVLHVAEQRAREAISMRSEVQREMDKERKEQELREALAQKPALCDTTRVARGDHGYDGDADTEPTGQTET